MDVVSSDVLLQRIAESLGHGESELLKQSQILETGNPQILQDFVDWLTTNGYRIEKRHTWTTCGWPVGDGETECNDPEHVRTEWYIVSDFNRLFGEYFGVDLAKVERERSALLDAIRKAHTEVRS